MQPVLDIIDDLQQGHDGDPWYGSPVQKLLEGVTAQQAAAKPKPAMHSIWQIVLHMIAWQGEVHRRLKGNDPEQPAEGNWPPVPAATEANWQAACSALTASLHELLEALKTLPETGLDRKVGTARDPSLGSGYSFGVMLRGLAQHNAYHAGQIAVVKQLGG